MPVSTEQLQVFMRLFEGSIRSFGQWDRTNGKMFTEKRAPTEVEFRKHLNGVKGIGVVPIVRDKFSKWGAIDIEEENLRDAEITLFDLEARIRQHNLPLTACRSKSGGAHLYYFRSDALNTSVVRKVLSGYAAKVGFPKVEVFPKQDQTSAQALGNWINLPYFNFEDTERFMVEGGKVQPFSYFLEAADTRARDSGTVTRRGITVAPEGGDSYDHSESPPCVASMLSGSLPEGHRNEGLFSIAVYLKRAFSESWRDMTHSANTNLTRPLAHGEVQKIITSVNRRDYRYKCSQEPNKSLCDSNTCVTRKFGITPTEATEVINERKTIQKPGFFANLRKITTDPVYWKIDVDDIEVTVNTLALMDFGKLRSAVADSHTRLIPTMKDKDWHVILTGLMETCEILNTPDEASTPGFVRAKLREFTAKISRNGHPEAHERSNILRGMPVVEQRFARKVIYFRGQDFVDFLKKTRAEEIKGANLWLALKQAGVDYTRIKIEGQAVNVWYVDLDEESGDIEFKTKDFKPEF